MEMNLAVGFVGNRGEGYEVRHGQNLIEGCHPNPSVQLRETRSSYFLDIDLPGLRREDIWLQMDNTRRLIIRGQRVLQDMGMVGWKWHLVQRGGSRQRPFRIPRDVNVNAVTAHFRHGVLHVAMPKLRWSRFTPYEINGRSSEGSHLQLFPRIETILQGAYAHQAGQTRLQSRNIPCEPKKFSEEIAGMPDAEEQVRNIQDVDIEMERPLQEGDQTFMVITLVEQSVESGPSSEPPQRISTEEAKEEEAVEPCDHVGSSSQNPQEERPHIDGEARETISAAPSHTSTVSKVRNMQDVDVEMEAPLHRHEQEGDQTSMVIRLEEQSVDFSAEESCPSSEPPQRISTEEAKEEEAAEPCDYVGNLKEERPRIQGEARETAIAAPSHSSTVSNAGAGEGTALLEEDIHEKEKVEETIPHCDQGKADKSVRKEKVVDPSCSQQQGEQAGMSKGFSNLFSSIAAIATLKWRRG